MHRTAPTTIVWPGMRVALRLKTLLQAKPELWENPATPSVLSTRCCSKGRVGAQRMVWGEGAGKSPLCCANPETEMSSRWGATRHLEEKN